MSGPRLNSRDPDRHGPGPILYMMAWAVLHVLLTYLAPLGWTNRPIKFICTGVQLAQVHCLLTSHLLSKGLDPGECGRDYFLIYGLYLGAVILWNLPRFMSQYFPPEYMSLEDMVDIGF